MPARIADKPRQAGAPALARGAVLPIAVPRLLVAIHRQRPDLAARFDIADPAGRDAYVTWCLTEGRSDYRAIADLGRAGGFAGLHDPDPCCPLAWPTALTGLMRLAWCARGDVRTEYPLPDRAEDFVWWFFLHGARELQLDDLVPPAAREDLNRPVMPPDDPGVPPVSRLMHRIWRFRPDLQAAFDPRLAADRIRFATWFLTTGVAELDLAWLLGPEQVAWRQAPWPGAPGSGLSNLMGETWHADPGLRQRFDPADPAGAVALLDWWRDGVPATTMGPAAWLAPAAAEPPRPGVDLVGYTRGELGIGEDVRTIACALDLAGVGHSAIDIRPDPSVRQDDRRLEHALVDRPVHRATVFAMTGVETVRVIATRGLAELRDRYVIGHWPWELPVWPRAWEGAYDLVDEIWTTTCYTRDAYVGRAPVPVVVMPPAVELPAGYRRWHRSDFGLPERAFLFHFSFDFLSYPHRKNPWACLEAFNRAFPSAAEPVGLVVKTMRADRTSPAWRRLVALAARDARIILIDRTMDRAETIGLMAATDAFLSLHRAEGFGRGLAEAMLLGLPVIATGYSGTTDFLTAQTGFPVDYRLVPVRKGQYPGSAGQHWADPSVDHAAAEMRRVYDDPALAATVAAAGRAHAESVFAPAAAGRRYRARLEALGLLDPDPAGR